MPFNFVCPQCHQPFVSRSTKKKFCSMRCYTGSDEFRNRMREHNRQLAEASRSKYGVLNPQERVTKRCLFCDKEFYVRMSEFDTHKYCSHVCYRRYRAERFDRWVANPETIALPQCYDEFLTKDELPCLIEGCSWRGKNLATHANFAHGIQAEAFKELAGFNKHTGLVTPALSEIISERAIRLNLGQYGNVGRLDEIRPLSNPAGKSDRLEGKEHRLKARALMDAAAQQSPRKANCLNCGKEFSSDVPSTEIHYCTVQCRGEFYAKRRWRLSCAQCGGEFWGTAAQRLRNERHKEVFCSFQCRAARAVVLGLTPNFRKHLQKLALKNDLPTL